MHIIFTYFNRFNIHNYIIYLNLNYTEMYILSLSIQKQYHNVNILTQFYYNSCQNVNMF